jgi:hypothetical protein
MLKCRVLHPVLGALLLVGTVGVVHGESIEEGLQPLIRAPLFAYPGLFNRMRANAAVAGAGGEIAAADVTQPALTAFGAGTTLDVGKPTPPFSILIKGKDNLSGVVAVTYFATGPSGQRIFGGLSVDYPGTGFSRRGGFSDLYVGRLLEPGAWVIDEAAVMDAAGNLGYYGAAALAALGNTRFTVVNGGTYDTVAPTLTSGQILTPTVSLSSFAKGTTTLAPYVGVKVTAADAGSTAVAGLAGAGATFCVADASRCIAVGVATPNAGNQPSGTLVLGSQVASVLGQSPGEYLLSAILLWDQAGNVRELVSTAFGGSTNFGKFFPTTKITLQP